MARAKGTAESGEVRGATEEELLLELVSRPARLPGELTSAEVAARLEITVAAANSRLRQALEAGQVTARKALVDGRIRMVYRVMP